MTCATGLCQGCASRWSARTARPAGPGLRRRPGVPRRPGALGRRWSAVSGRPVSLDLPHPVMVRRRLRRHRPRARGVHRPRRPRRLRHPLDHPRRPAAAARRPGSWRPRAGSSTPMGLQNPGLDQFLATELPWLVAQGARVVRLDRRPLAGGVRRAGAPAGPHPGRRRDRGQHLAPPDAGGRGRLRRPRAVPRRRGGGRGPPRPAPRPAGAGQAAARPAPRRRDAPAPWSRPAPTPSSSATRCPPRCPTAARRAERPGDPAARAALRGRGARRRCRTLTVVGVRRHRHRRRRPRLPRRRRRRRPGRHRPAARPHHRRAAARRAEPRTAG